MNSSSLSQELLDDFFAEADQYLLNIRNLLLELENCNGASAAYPAHIGDLFLNFHSFKGISAIVGLQAAEDTDFGDRVARVDAECGQAEQETGGQPHADRTLRFQVVVSTPYCHSRALYYAEARRARAAGRPRVCFLLQMWHSVGRTV